MNGKAPGPKSDWRERLKAAGVMDAVLAVANPERGIVVMNEPGEAPQLYGLDSGSGETWPLTERAGGVQEGFVDARGAFVYYLHDEKGDELGHLRRIPFRGGEAVDVTPEMARYTLRGVAFSASGNLLAFTPIGPEGFQVAVLPLDERGQPGDVRILYRSQFEAWSALPSQDGTLVVTQSTERAGGTRLYNLLVLDARSGDRLAELWDEGASVEPVTFAPLPGDTRILANSSRSGFRRPVIWEPLSDTRQDLELPEIAGDLVALDWSADGQRILISGFNSAVQQLYTYHLAEERLVQLAHPAGGYGAYGGLVGHVAFFGPRGELFALWETASKPMRLIALDGETGELTRTVVQAGESPPGRPWQSVHFRSSDGETIQGWLSIPEGNGPFPTILDMHGGPHAVVTESYNPMDQVWTDEGFAFLTINFRGSTSFGQAFQQKIWGDLGHWELEDMVAARDWLIEQGIARPDAVILKGGSYGGFLTLLALGKRPSLWAGGISLAGIADWTINYADASDAMKGAFRAWFGGHSPDERPDLYRASSPITYVEQVQAPVLIIQGQHDTRTPSRQMETYVERLEALGKEHEAIWFDAGHGGGLEMEQIAVFVERMVVFAKRRVAAQDPG